MELKPTDREAASGRLDAWRRLPRPVRILLPVLLVVPPVFAPSGLGTSELAGPWAAALIVVALAVVAVRQQMPRSALVVATVLAVVGLALRGPFVALLTALVVVVYSVARHTDRRTAVVATTVAALVVGAAASVLVAAEWGPVRAFVQVAALVGFAGALGDGSRSRQAYVDAVTERARRAEEGLESEARSRVAEERLRIARDLHDVMAHQIAVINLHAGVASQAVRERPADAERSLRTIREAARTVLAEIESLLRVLRSTDAGARQELPTTAPVAGLADIEQLIAEFGRSGLRVDVRTVGRPVAVPGPVDMVAYRVVQEGLTNAHKHGLDGSALLQLDYGLHELEISVTNTVGPGTEEDGPVGGGGHGLLGARERVGSVDGRLHTGFGPGPVHRLTATLPLAPGSGT